jgi:hypothetical protein
MMMTLQGRKQSLEDKPVFVSVIVFAASCARDSTVPSWYYRTGNGVLRVRDFSYMREGVCVCCILRVRTLPMYIYYQFFADGSIVG